MSSNDNAVRVTIVGDASGVAPAVNVAKGSIESLGPTLASVNASMAALTERMEAGFAAIASGSAEAFGGMGLAAKAGAVKVAESANIVTLASEKIVLAGEAAKAKWETVGMGFSKLNGIMLGITAALAGGEIFKETISATTKLTQENLQLSRALGVTLEKASGVHSAMNKLGIGVDQVTGASQKMVRMLKAHEDQFNKVGIATRDANGHFRDTLDILTSGLGKLGEYRAGVDRTAVAQMMFGRGAGDLTTLMRLNNAEIEEGARVAKELGLVTTSEGVAAMYKYKDATREVSEVMEGMKVAIGNALLPVLTEMATWMRGHGAAAIQFLRENIVDLIDTFKEIKIALDLLDANVAWFQANFYRHVEEVQSACEVLWIAFKTLGKIVVDALTLNWGAIEGDWKAGMAEIDATVTTHAKHIADEMGKATAAVDGLERAYANVRNHQSKDQDGLGDPKDLYASGIVRRPDEGGAMRQDDITGKKGKGTKSKKEKAPKDDLVQILDEELEAQKTAWDKRQDAQGTYQQFSLASEAAFWAAALQRHDLNGKDRLQIERKYHTARLAVLHETQAAETEASKAHAAMATEIAKSDIALAKLTLHEKIAAIDEEEKRGHLSAARAQAMRAQVNRQIYQLDVDLAENEYKIQLKSLQDELKILGEKPGYYAKINNDILLLAQTNADQMVLLNRKKNDQERADDQKTADLQRKHFQDMVAPFAQALGKMATLQQGFAATFKSMWGSLQSIAANAIGNIVKKFIAGLLEQAFASKVFHSKEVILQAKQAAAGAYAAIAKIPYVGPFLAPAAAAVAYAGVMAFSAEGGYDVPTSGGGGMDGRGGMMGIVHPGEMVLPRHLADAVRGVASGSSFPGGNSTGPGQSAGNSNEAHFHYAPTIHHSDASLESMLQREGHAARKWFANQHRNGALKPMAA